MIKKCVICGKEFKCSPSDKIITCGKECSAIRKRQSHLGKSNVWNDKSKENLSQKGKTGNLLKGTDAAKKSPNSGRFITNVNAIDWHLISPSGKHYYCHSLNNWLRENGRELFGVEPDSREFHNVSCGLSGAKRAMMGKKYGCCTYKGWSVIPMSSNGTINHKDDRQDIRAE